MVDAAAAEERDVPHPARARRWRIGKWLVALVGAIILALGAGALVLNTPLGQRFLVNRIAAHTMPNGLNIRIGRIIGDIYGEAVLLDVTLSDTKGPFLAIPRVELDWNPSGWLRNTLDVSTLVARRGKLSRLPEFLPSEDDSPVLPGFDIAIDRFAIDQLALAPGIAGKQQQEFNLKAKLHVRDRRFLANLKGRLGSQDYFRAMIDAEPDGEVFDLSFDYHAPAGGVMAGLLGAKAGYRAQIEGDGTWRKWDGAFVVRRAGARFAAFKLTNRGGRFGMLGQLYPDPAIGGPLEKLLGDTVSLAANATIDDRVIDGSYAVRGDAVTLDAKGAIDLAENRASDFAVDLRIAGDADLDEGLRVKDARLEATLDGAFSDLSIKHRMRAGRLIAGGIEIAGFAQSGTASYDGNRWLLPLSASVGKVVMGNEMLDAQLTKGKITGAIRLRGKQLSSGNLVLAFPHLRASLALRGDLARGSYRLAGKMTGRQLVFANIGTAKGSVKLDLSYAGADTWNARAMIDAVLSPVSNATLSNLVGDPILIRGAIRAGARKPLRFDNILIGAPELRAHFDGQLAGGGASLNGAGVHDQFGAFTIDASFAEKGPEAVLVFARPLPAAGLRNVRIALSPSEDGFEIETEGGSTFGPFEGRLHLIAPEGGPTRIAVKRFTLSDTNLTGNLTFAERGLAGKLALSGGGLSGSVSLAPRDGGQGIAVDISARNATFSGATPIRIARADIDFAGLIAENASTFSGKAHGSGLTYGSFSIARFAAQGSLTDGEGRIDASIAGHRGSNFKLDLRADIAPQTIALAARGDFSGERISMPRRAVLTALDAGGWALAPTQINYGTGVMIASGRFGGEDIALDLKLAEMPLSLIDVANADLGLGGAISGLIEYRAEAGGLPQGSAKVKIDSLTRSGLLLTSKPVDLSLVAELSPSSLTVKAALSNEEIQQGSILARITQLPAAGGLIERLRTGQLSARLRYSGAAESLWRLAALDIIDLSGPVALTANASGSLANPEIRGRLSSDSLRVQSALSGTDVRNVTVRGRFAGSRLSLRRFSGATANGGTVSGSGSIDLEGLGGRVSGRFVEIRGPKLDLKIAANKARLLDSNGLSAVLTGPLRIVSGGLGGTIAGRVHIDRASWRLGSASEAAGLPRIATREINLAADKARESASGRPWRYLINASGSDRIEVDGMGLDSEWGADIHLRGTTEEPRITGEARMVRGTYAFAGASFDLTRGVIEFQGNSPIDPRLNIRAESESDGFKAIVLVRGTALEPEITFSSNPALPEEEILARLLFGGSITGLSATDALQLGAALASLRGGAGLDPINQLRSAIGLDRLRIVSADPAIGRGTSVALGKNIGRRFYVELITDGEGYSATELEFRITSWLSLLATVSTIGRESVVAEISRDY